jgi:hypothetical protein
VARLLVFRLLPIPSQYVAARAAYLNSKKYAVGSSSLDKLPIRLKEQKPFDITMKFQRSTLILLVFALGLAGSVYVYETQVVPEKATHVEKERQIFSFKEESIASFKIKKEREILKFERLAVQSSDLTPRSRWQTIEPINASASEPAVAFLLNLLVNIKSNDIIAVLPERLQEYGLAPPLATIEIQLKDRQNHQVLLGKTNFDGNLLYALVDPPSNPSEKIEVFLIPLDLQNAIDRPLSEWQIEKPKSSQIKL